MIIRKSTFFLGILVSLMPFVGLPTFWKTLFLVFLGSVLALSSVDFSFPKKISKPKNKKEKNFDITIENMPVYPRDNIVDVPIIVETVMPKPEKRKATRKQKVSQ